MNGLGSAVVAKDQDWSATIARKERRPFANVYLVLESVSFNSIICCRVIIFYLLHLLMLTEFWKMVNTKSSTLIILNCYYFCICVCISFPCPLNNFRRLPFCKGLNGSVIFTARHSWSRACLFGCHYRSLFLIAHAAPWCKHALEQSYSLE